MRRLIARLRVSFMCRRRDIIRIRIGHTTMVTGVIRPAQVILTATTVRITVAPAIMTVIPTGTIVGDTVGNN